MKMVVFDLDGVVLDSEPMHAESVRRVLARQGVTELEPMDYVGMSNQEMWAAFIERYGLRGTPEELTEQCVDEDEDQMAAGIEPSAGLVELLDHLEARGIKIGLASSSQRRFIDRTLKELGLLERFPYRVTANDVERRKPHPDPYLKAVAMAGVAPSDAAAVEDSATGIRAAKGAGLYCIGYRNPTSGEQDLSQADAVVDRLADAGLFLF